MTEILVVEDDPAIAHLLECCLGLEGFGVELIADGGAAVARLAEPPPSLVLLDVRLPVHDGMTVLRRLRDTPAWAGVPVILLTGSTGDRFEALGLGLGADDYILKPFGINALLTRVTRLLPTGLSASR